MDTGRPASESDIEDLLGLCHRAADAVAAELAKVADWGPSGRRSGQYAVDLVADRAAIAPLVAAGLDVLSEESGLTTADRDLLAIVDPLDGSTNASRGIPWFATSICILDEHGPLVGLVVDQTGVRHGTRGPRWSAARGGGATRDGAAIEPSDVGEMRRAVVALSGLPPTHLGWAQFRALGAVALDLCLVADGTIDGFIDCSRDAHGAWDHAAGALVCTESGAAVADAFGRDLVPRDHAARRTPIAASSSRLLEQIGEARRGFH